MSFLVLVDTSAWVQAMRRSGDATIRKQVTDLFGAGRATMCDMTRVELWAGVRGAHEREYLKQVEQSLPVIPVTADVWQAACDLAESAQKQGLHFPPGDLIIFACSRVYAMDVLSVDRHFDLMRKMVDPA